MTNYYPQREANNITILLRTVGAAEYPLDVRTIATEISSAKYPDDPISVIKGENLPGFEGALFPAPAGKSGWGIFYNNAISSAGRINFTLGHEFGHYMLHRRDYPSGFACSAEDMASWKSEYGQREQEANSFAATLLMPLDDFRLQINSHELPGYDKLGVCADRYDVSLIAATLRWLHYTSRCAMLVVSRDGYVLWARSSGRALKSGLFLRTRNQPPVAIPGESLAAKSQSLDSRPHTASFDDDVWFNKHCVEHVLVSPQYDFVLSLLHFPDSGCPDESLEDEVEDSADQMRRWVSN